MIGALVLGIWYNWNLKVDLHARPFGASTDVKRHGRSLMFERIFVADIAQVLSQKCMIAFRNENRRDRNYCVASIGVLACARTSDCNDVSL